MSTPAVTRAGSDHAPWIRALVENAPLLTDAQCRLIRDQIQAGRRERSQNP